MALCAPSVERMISLSFNCIAAVSQLWVLWMRNTMRNVMIVVRVLVTNCQESLIRNTGPARPHISTIPIATPKLSYFLGNERNSQRTEKNIDFCSHLLRPS